MNNALKELRLKNNYTQRNMADFLGLKTVSAYCKKEKGASPISLQEAKILSEKLNKPIEFFCT